METETGRLIRLERKVDELRDQIRRKDVGMTVGQYLLVTFLIWLFFGGGHGP